MQDVIRMSQREVSINNHRMLLWSFSAETFHYQDKWTFVRVLLCKKKQHKHRSTEMWKWINLWKGASGWVVYTEWYRPECLTSTARGSSRSVVVWDACPLRGKGHCKPVLRMFPLILSGNTSILMGGGLFQDDNALIHMTQGFTEWFDQRQK